MSQRADAIPLVLCPGLEGTGSLFDPFLEALGPGRACHVVRYGDRRTSLAAHADDVLVALERAGSPALLVGESFGGPVALSAAMQRPEQVHALVLVATFVTEPVRMLHRLQRLYHLAAALPLPVQLRGEVLRRSHCSPGAPESLVRQLTRVNAPRRAALQAHRLGLLVDLDLRASLGALPRPVAYLAGSADAIVPVRRHARQILAVRPDAWVRLLPGGPHLLLQCRPHDCAELLQRFVEAVAKTPDSAPTPRVEAGASTPASADGG